MGKHGGPCQAPGKTEGTICGETEISDKSDWRRGGKHKPEHAGKWCCTKNLCRIALGVILDPKAPKAEIAPSVLPREWSSRRAPRCCPNSPGRSNRPGRGACGGLGYDGLGAGGTVRAGRGGGQAQRPRRGGGERCCCCCAARAAGTARPA